MSNEALNSPVLVLDKSYRPILISSFKEVIGDVFLGNTFILPETYIPHTAEEWIEHSKTHEHLQHTTPVVRTPNCMMLVFDIVIEKDYVATGKHMVKIPCSRNNVIRRDNNTCQYCSAKLPRSSLTIDHVMPKSRGGKYAWNNLSAACKKCNAKKADRTPSEAGMKLLSEPSKPNWQEFISSGHNIKESWRPFLTS